MLKLDSNGPSCFCLLREISLRTKVDVYHSVCVSIHLYDCGTWPEQIGDNRIAEVLISSCIHYILRMKCIYRSQTFDRTDFERHEDKLKAYVLALQEGLDNLSKHFTGIYLG